MHGESGKSLSPRKTTAAEVLLALGVFGFMLIFFSSVHPLVLHDGDDWAYSCYTRGALPIWGYWNPARVLPEIFSPVCASAAAYLLMPLTEDFNAAYTLMAAFIVSVCITIYVVMLMLLLRRAAGCEPGTAAMLAALFVILHFLIFRSERQGNDHLFYSWNVNTYFFYTIPNLLNSTLVLLWAGRKGLQKRARSELANGFLLLVVYLAVFSNLFSSQILAVFAFVSMIMELLRNRREGMAACLHAFREQSGSALVLVIWLVAMIFELSGSRAESLSGGTGLMQRFVDTLHGLLARFRTLNGKFVGISVLAVALALLVLAFTRTKDERDRCFSALFASFLTCAALSGILTVLLCTASSPDYIRRSDVLFPGAFFGTVCVILSLGYLAVRIPRAAWVLPLLGLVLIFETDTRVKTFKEPNIDQYTAQQCAAINDAVMGQVLQADADGVTELEVEVPSGSFFFLSDAVMRTMLKCGMIDNYIVCTNVELEDFWARYGI